MDRPRSTTSGGRPGVLDVVERVLRALVLTDPGSHLLPERTCADRAGHQVRTVEAEDRVAVLQDLDGSLVDRARAVGEVEVLVGADEPPTGGRLALLVAPLATGDVGPQRLRLHAVAVGCHDPATT